MEQPRPLDRFRLRQIEQRLTAELQAADDSVRRASTDAERRKALESYRQALQRFKDFAAKGVVPEDLSGPPGSQK